MTGKTRISATPEAIAALKALGQSNNRGEADRSRAILLTLEGWTAGQVAQAFWVREDTVRQWRSDFMRDGVEALKARVRTGRVAKKSQAALRVAEDLFDSPVGNRANWTLPRLAVEIERREGVSISRAQLSKALKKGALCTKDRGTR